MKDRLKDIRTDRDKKQTEIAEILKVRQEQYSRWERKPSIMPIEKYIELAKYYNVTLDYLVGIDDYVDPFDATVAANTARKYQHDIRTQIRNAREDKDLSQQEVADLIPMHQTSYSRIERGFQEPNIQQLRRICQILDISADCLLRIREYKDVTESDIRLLKDIKKFIREHKEI